MAEPSKSHAGGQPENNKPSFGSLKIGPLEIEPLHYLLLAAPVALILRWTGAGDLWVFFFSCAAIIPLAGLMGRATENLAETMGAGIGGLLNATFGNAAELIIALIALWRGKMELVKASITGSIIGNVLLVLGLSILFGGLFHKKQVFNRTAAGMGATLLALACIGLLIPTVYYHVFYQSQHDIQTEARKVLVQEKLIAEKKLDDPALAEKAKKEKAEQAEHTRPVVYLSEEISGILIFVYVLSLFFSLWTHQHLFAGPEEQLPTTGEHHQPEWSRKTSLMVLLLATVGVAVMAEVLVGSVESAAHALGMNEIFVGVIVVAVVGNAAEHSTAVLVAMKNKMDLAYTIAVGSSLQIALFVAPVLVFASLLMGHWPPLDLHFSVLETICIILAVAVVALIAQDGESHWMEGVMLLAVYIIIALAFYHLPQPVAGGH